MNRSIRIPDASHPITIESNPRRVVVTVKGRVVADTRAALTLREARYDPVQYVPMADVDATLLAPSQTTTYCPYKGDCAYFDVVVGDERVADAIWTYRSPYDAVAAIRDHVAFYPDRVDAIDERAS